MKIVDAKTAAKLISNNATITIGGVGGSGSPEAVLHAIEKRYLKTKEPKNLTIMAGIAPGNLTTDDVGMNTLAHEGLVGLAICTHLGMGKNFGALMAQNKFPAYGIPLGVYGHLLRAIAGYQVGVLTHIGLETFADPRIEGCASNDEALKNKTEVVELINVLGKDQLLYKSRPVNVAIIKASYADEDGNISFREEGVIGEQFEAAIAAHNSGGIVIVEVRGIVPKESIPAREVIIPKRIVDYVVVATPDVSLGDYNLPIYRPEVSGEIKLREGKVPILPLTERKICARRAILELKKGNLVNLGVGMPDAVGMVAKEEGVYKDFSISVESGTIGGVPLAGLGFGSAQNLEALISSTQCFDMYDGGVLDMSVLGCAEVDKAGNVNVSKLGGTRVTGPGGFINITQTTKKVIFIGTFTAGGLQVEVKNGKLKIVQEGKYVKFKKQVGQITMSADYAVKNKQEILYVTERAVFKLTKGGIELIEIAPGIDINKHILPYMEFKPKISKDLRVMDSRIFANKKMGIKLK